MDLRKYWRSVRLTEETLPAGDVFLISVENEERGTSGGQISSATREYAARWIVGGTHRLATEPEIELYRLEMKARTDAILVAELNKKQTVRLETVIPEDQIARAVAAAVEAALGRERET
jgi:hypothetical protein